MSRVCGAIVAPHICADLLRSRANGLLQLFHRKGVLPGTLRFQAALGDVEGVRASLAATAPDLKSINEAFSCACRFARDEVAALLLERAIALDPVLGERIDGNADRGSFIAAFAKADTARVAELGPWPVFVMEQVWRALHATIYRRSLGSCSASRGC